MKILLVHNRYQQRGGEDIVYETEREMLERAGHDICVYERHNDEISRYSTIRSIDLFRRTTWATDSAAEIRRIVSSAPIQLAYFFNTFPLVSPSSYYVCQSHGVKVVQNVPNYRLICPAGQLTRSGRICEDCLPYKIPWPGIAHRCYRHSILQSTAVTLMLSIHRKLRTWHNQVDRYIALTEFSKNKLIIGGLPSAKIAVKPNFLYPDPGPGNNDGEYVLFIGRLSPEKGVSTLLSAWSDIPHIPLKIAGDGPLYDLVSRAAAERHQKAPIEVLGWRSRNDILALLKRARFLVVPSEWYEGFPLTIVEAFACGVPVVGSKLGAVGEIVRDGVSGILFSPGSPRALTVAVSSLWASIPLRSELARNARSQFETSYTSERNYQQLMKIFSEVLQPR